MFALPHPDDLLDALADEYAWFARSGRQPFSEINCLTRSRRDRYATAIAKLMREESRRTIPGTEV